jgi:predicted dehydrogenase
MPTGSDQNEAGQLSRMKPIRIPTCIVGYGYWGPNLARNIALSPATELTAICDADGECRRRARRQYPSVPVVDSWEDVLNDDEIAAVVIALPMASHYDFALQALEAGKHVMVEKPLAETVAQCDSLQAAAARNDRVLMVGHTFEYNAAVTTIGEYLRNGLLGEPYYIAMRRLNLGIVRSDGNAMWSLAPHDISILCSWLERDPISVSASGVAHLQPGIEDVVFLTVEFDGGVLGHIQSSWLDPNKVREATVVGSEKMLVYDDVSPDAKLRLYDKGIDRKPTDRSGNEKRASLDRAEDFASFQMIARAGDILIPKIDFREPLAVQVEHFGRCAQEGSTPRTDVVSGRRVVAVLEAAQRSLRSGGQREAVSLSPRHTEVIA